MHYHGPLLILAGAGSGKTRVITQRISYLISEKNTDPYRILALTFTNKAAGEMKQRVIDTVKTNDAYKVFVSTFHSLCVRILRKNAEHIGYSNTFTIYDADDQRSLMKRVIKDMGLDPKKNRERTFLSVISSAKDKLLDPEKFARENENDFEMKKYIRAYIEYEKRLKDANAFDFDDLILKTVELFEDHPSVLENYQQRFEFVMVDEYQDTNYAQFKLISLLANHRLFDGTVLHNICVVGDDDQSIYKFRGADIKNILNFEKIYPDTKIVKLEENYRSTANILDAANGVIKHNFERKPKTLRTSKIEGDLVYYKLFPNEHDEGYGVADSINTAVNRYDAKYSDFAVLYRTNAQSRAVEESLVRLNIPYKIVGGVNFYARREIKDILAYLHVINNPNDSVSINRIINVPKRGIGAASLDKVMSFSFENGMPFYDALANADQIDGLKRAKDKILDFIQLIDDFREAVLDHKITIPELIKAIIDVTEYDSYLKDDDELKYDDRMENIDELIAKAVDYENSNEEDANLSEFLSEISLVSDLDSVEEDDNLVLLMTLHSAKGLEFPYVFIVGMENNLFPSYMSLNPYDETNGFEELEEERRLAYVGITRAETKLALSSTISRFRNGEYEYNSRSQFVDEIPSHLLCVTRDRLMPFGDEVNKIHSKPVTNHKKTPVKKQPLFTFKSSVTQSSIKKSKASAASLQVGDRVKHSKFGEGEITEITPKGNDRIIAVNFDNGNTRKLVASLAGLEKI